MESPDERVFRLHLRGAPFQQGVDDGRWRLISVGWPHALIAVSAPPRTGAPGEFVLRFELSHYPTTAPTGAAWDMESNALLPEAMRPKGGQAGLVFRTNWQGGQALYAPWDRVALETHDANWAARYPTTRWTPERDIAFYLRNVSEVLHDDEYLGI